MTLKESYTVSLRINAEDKENLDFLKRSGRTIISVLRKGIEIEVRKERTKK